MTALGELDLNWGNPADVLSHVLSIPYAYPKGEGGIGCDGRPHHCWNDGEGTPESAGIMGFHARFALFEVGDRAASPAAAAEARALPTGEAGCSFTSSSMSFAT